MRLIMLNIDNLFIFSMIILGTIGLVGTVVFWIADIVSIILFDKVEANIIEYHIYETQSFLSHDFSVYNIYIKYTYKYKSLEYISTRLNGINSITKSKTHIDKIMEQVNTAENKVLAYVCPFYPKYSVVFPLQFNGLKNLFMLLLALFSLLCGIYFLYVRYKLGAL